MVKYVSLFLMGWLVLASTSGFAYNSCLSNSTIDYLNNTNITNGTMVLNDLSNICDRLDVLSGNLLATNNSILSLNSSLINQTDKINNITDNSQIINSLNQKVSNYDMLSGKINDTQSSLDKFKSDTDGSVLVLATLSAIFFITSVVITIFLRKPIGD